MRPLLVLKTLGRVSSRSSCSFDGAYKLSGSLRERPIADSFGTRKSLGIAIPFICLGGYVSMKGAAFLEEHDIFVPEDDD
uniref:Essential MCU regulator, mitochondrial n=1 Tax=Mesocestoides corti TaxID=53468 RepID=A0A5K3G513_MESCO